MMKKNYLLIVEQLNNSFVNCYENGNTTLAKNIVNEFKKNPKLVALNSAISNLKNERISPEFVDQYIIDNINEIKKYDFSDLDGLLNENMKGSEYLNDIATILFTEKNIHNLAQYTKSYQAVKNHLIENFQWKNSAKEKLSSLEEQMSSLEDEDRVLVENYIKMDLVKRTHVFEDLKNECVGLLKEYINKETNPETKLNLYETKEKIMQSSPHGDNYLERLINLHNLKKDLKA